MSQVPGRKDDTGKLDITLLFDDLPHALEAVTEVLQWAVTKKEPVPYDRGSWQGVTPFQPRYRAALLRHMLDSAKQHVTLGVPIEKTRDAETQLLHLAHIATDAMFQLEMAIRELKVERSKLIAVPGVIIPVEPLRPSCVKCTRVCGNQSAPPHLYREHTECPHHKDAT